jgi:hypothetical protein
MATANRSSSVATQAATFIDKHFLRYINKQLVPIRGRAGNIPAFYFLST